MKKSDQIILTSTGLSLATIVFLTKAGFFRKVSNNVNYILKKQNNRYQAARELGVSNDADIKTIKKAYFDLAQQYHPDAQRNFIDQIFINEQSKLIESNHKTPDNEKFIKIHQAYKILTQPTQTNLQMLVERNKNKQ